MRKAMLVLLALLALGVLASCGMVREGRTSTFNVKWEGGIRVLQHIKTGECWIGLWDNKALTPASPAVCADVFGQ